MIIQCCARAGGLNCLREIAVFRIARASGFDSLSRSGSILSRHSAAAAGPAVVSLHYPHPHRYLIAPVVAPAAVLADKAAQSAASAPGQVPLWQDIWWARSYEIAVLGAMLTVLGGILIFQDTVTAHGRFYYRLLIQQPNRFTFVFLGLIANAQLSVVHVLTFMPCCRDSTGNSFCLTCRCSCCGASSRPHARSGAGSSAAGSARSARCRN